MRNFGQLMLLMKSMDRALRFAFVIDSDSMVERCLRKKKVISRVLPNKIIHCHIFFFHMYLVTGLIRSKRASYYCWNILGNPAKPS